MPTHGSCLRDLVFDPSVAEIVGVSTDSCQLSLVIASASRNLVCFRNCCFPTDNLPQWIIIIIMRRDNSNNSNVTRDSNNSIIITIIIIIMLRDNNNNNVTRGSNNNSIIIIIIIIITGKHSTDSLQKTAILGTSHIIRKVLQCDAWSVSGGDHCWFNRSTGKKRPVTRDIHIV